MRIGLFAVAFALSAGAAMAQGNAGSPASDAADAAPTPEAIVCVTEEPPLGSRIGSSRVCHTAAQWKIIHRSAQDFMNRVQRGPINSPGGTGG